GRAAYRGATFVRRRARSVARLQTTSMTANAGPRPTFCRVVSYAVFERRLASGFPPAGRRVASSRGLLKPSACVWFTPHECEDDAARWCTFLALRLSSVVSSWYPVSTRVSSQISCGGVYYMLDVCA